MVAQGPDRSEVGFRLPSAFLPPGRSPTDEELPNGWRFVEDTLGRVTVMVRKT